MTYLVIATVGFVFNWLFNRKRVVEYEILASLFYLTAFIFIQSFDILYVEYALFFILPYLKDFRRVKRYVFVFLLYIVFEIIMGLMFESIVSVSATFLTRFFPMIFVSIIGKDSKMKSVVSDEYEQKLLRLVVVCEVILTAVLMYTNKGSETFVISHQPVGGNLSLVGVLLSMDISLKKGREREQHRFENILYSVLFVVLALLSGIRGYVIIILPCAFYSVTAYLFSEKKRKVGLVLTVLVAVGVISISYIAQGRLATLLESFDTSLGYREMENQYFFQSMKSTNPLRWIFGYGVGARGERIGSGMLIQTLAGESAYYTYHLTNGSVLLNFWLTVVKDMGIIGLLIYATMYIKLIPSKESQSSDRRGGWILYAVLYAFMLCYRTSCTNGMIELYVFSLLMCSDLFREESQTIGESKEELNESKC